MKKKKRIIIVFTISFIAAKRVQYIYFLEGAFPECSGKGIIKENQEKLYNTVLRISLRALMVDIVRRGRRILKALSDARLPPFPPLKAEMKLVITIVKSNIFQESLRYDPGLKINPIPTIFSAASTF